MPISPSIGKRLLTSQIGLPMQTLVIAALPSRTPVIPWLLSSLPAPGWDQALYLLWIGNFLAALFIILLLLRRFLRSIPRDLDDAARLDGCGFWRFSWHVLLPLAGPTLSLVGMVTLMAVWDDFIAPLVHGSAQPLRPPGISMGADNFGVVMAACLLLAAPVIAAFSFAWRYFRKAPPPAAAKT